jgi:hypothetical protein
MPPGKGMQDDVENQQTKVVLPKIPFSSGIKCQTLPNYESILYNYILKYSGCDEEGIQRNSFELRSPEFPRTPSASRP